jgi:predicted nucleic acid-binding protein
MRVVLDTNVLISAAFWTGKPKQIMNKVRREEITFLTSEFTLLLHKDAVESTAYPHKKAIFTILMIPSKGHYLVDPVDDVDLTAVPLLVRV